MILNLWDVGQPVTCLKKDFVETLTQFEKVGS